MDRQDRAPTLLASAEPPEARRRARAGKLRQNVFGVCSERYRSLKRRLAEMLGRGDRDYSTLTALSQEIGRMRRRIREGLHKRRQARRNGRSLPQAKRLAT